MSFIDWGSHLRSTIMETIIVFNNCNVLYICYTLFHSDYFTGGITGDTLTIVIVVAAVIVVGGIIGGVLVWLYKR